MTVVSMIFTEGVDRILTFRTTGDHIRELQPKSMLYLCMYACATNDLRDKPR